jgi:putative Holliday junction resolvase
MQSLHKHGSVMALDVGGQRIGVAVASMQARLASPLTTLISGESTPEDLQALIDLHDVQILVVGLPRGLDGQHTAQTVAVEEFKSNIEHALTIPVYWQDEAVTSKQAEAELEARGRPYKKADIDALSATYILEDFIRDHPEVFLI